MHTIINILENAGYEAWYVGGFVRDKILGKHSEDIDITTNASWQDVKQLCEASSCKVIETGIKHGTVTVIKDSKHYEVTTYRLDGIYLDNRHPDNVEFVNNIKDDLARRDFTINAIAYHPTRGYYDPYNGTKDIKDKIIKTVGNPEIRFSEDALRILRAARFNSQLGFTVDEETKKSALKQKALLNNISKERIRDELTKLLKGPENYQALMEFKEIIATCIPEMEKLIGFDQHTKYHCYDIYEHTAMTVKNIPLDKYSKKETEMLLWAALLHDVGKPEVFFMGDNGQGHFYGHPKKSAEATKTILKNLKFPNKFIKNVCELVRWHDHPTRPTLKSVRRMLRRLDPNSAKNNYKLLLDLRRADSLAHAPEYINVKVNDEIEEVYNEIMDNNLPYCIKSLDVDGKDLIQNGIKPGPNINETLNNILNAVINNEVENEKQALIKWVSQHIS